MVTRSLIDVFVLMRNNAVRNRLISSDQECGENISLVTLNALEEGSCRRQIALPPVWLDRIDEMQYLLATLRLRINELKGLYANQLHRPTFDDLQNQNNKSQIDDLVKDISLHFNKAHNLIQSIKNYSNESSNNDKKLIQNIFKSMAKTLQDLSVLYRSIQSEYINELYKREQRSKLNFEDSFEPENFSKFENLYSINSQSEQDQLVILEDDTKNAFECEKEINKIAKSIKDLHEIFNELAFMVSDQGTVLDRIDFNIEQTDEQVHEGFKQLQRAHRFKTKNRKMCFTLGLSVIVIVVLYLFIEQLSS